MISWPVIPSRSPSWLMMTAPCGTLFSVTVQLLGSLRAHVTRAIQSHGSHSMARILAGLVLPEQLRHAIHALVQQPPIGAERHVQPLRRSLLSGGGFQVGHGKH